jgi:D-glycero-D-manno-heptose 1,7-bisphosphate phosphatase
LSPEPPKRRKAAFIDRDGVINVESAYVYRTEDFEFLPGAIEALRQLQAAGYLIVVVTNQSGIARGLYTEADYWKLTRHMQTQLSAAGVQLSAVEHCPHLPDAEVEDYRLDCSCRKPRTGMFDRAAIALNIDVSVSILVGDRATDIQAGRSAGVGRCWLVRSGHPVSSSDIELADAVYDDLGACVQQALQEAGSRSAGGAVLPKGLLKQSGK